MSPFAVLLLAVAVFCNEEAEVVPANVETAPAAALGNEDLTALMHEQYPDLAGYLKNNVPSAGQPTAQFNQGSFPGFNAGTFSGGANKFTGLSESANLPSSAGQPAAAGQFNQASFPGFNAGNFGGLTGSAIPNVGSFGKKGFGPSFSGLSSGTQFPGFNSNLGGAALNNIPSNLGNQFGVGASNFGGLNQPGFPSFPSTSAGLNSESAKPAPAAIPSAGSAAVGNANSFSGLSSGTFGANNAQFPNLNSALSGGSFGGFKPGQFSGSNAFPSFPNQFGSSSFPGLSNFGGSTSFGGNAFPSTNNFGSYGGLGSSNFPGFSGSFKTSATEEEDVATEGDK